jgi:hypothetical protein
MKNLFVAVLGTWLILTACDKNTIERGTPACVNNKIYEFDNETICTDSVRVEEYIFQSKTVYVFCPGICGADMTSQVIDSECNALGYLGGFIGNTVINGEDFDHALFVKIIWEK